jgi:hypothetical protein
MSREKVEVVPAPDRSRQNAASTPRLTSAIRHVGLIGEFTVRRVSRSVLEGPLPRQNCVTCAAP